jgi:hypothetical protein
MARKALVAFLALVGVTCNQAILTSPAGSTMTVIANPTFIAANGEVSVISAVVIEPTGQPVVDGTVIQFFTSLGRIDAQGKTNDGVARVNLQSDRNSGAADITAISGANTATTTVTIGSGRPAFVIVSADPPRIQITTPQRRSRITANVLDSAGNPVRNVPVFFSIVGSPATETLASGGQPIFTDTNGQASDFLQTSYSKKEVPKTVTVTATTANNISSSTSVTIN